MVRLGLEGHERSANAACVRTVHGFCGVAGAAVKVEQKEKIEKQPPMGFSHQSHHRLVIFK